MNFLIEKSIYIREKFLIKNLFDIIEYIFVKLVPKISQKNIILNYFQLYSDGSIFSIVRQEKSKIYQKSKENIIKEIDKNSFAIVGNSENDIVEKGKNYFLKQEYLFNTHVVKPQNRNLKISMNEFLYNDNCNYGSFDLKTTINCKHLQEILIKNKVIKIAKKYLLSENIFINSINTMLSKPSNKRHGVLKLHRDHDSMNSITFFLYWTETDRYNGSTALLPGSHIFKHDKRFSKVYTDNISLKYLEGKPGTIYAVDTWAWHKGNENITSPRLVTWIRLSSAKSQVYFKDKNYIYEKELNNYLKSLSE
tara:strand:+ start:3420 stop:4343 length:924 start_codon:yes stop_codon:yes gene_type:complete